MEPIYFPNREFNKVPCGMVAFSNHAPWKIIFANEEYYTYYSDNNYLTLNIYNEDMGMLNSLEERLSVSSKTNLFYRCKNEGDERKVSMTVAKYTDTTYLGILWDATERHKMLEEAQLEKEKFAMALCNSRNIVFEDNLIQDIYTLYVPYADSNKVDTVRMKGAYAKLADEIVYENDKDFFLKNIYNPDEKMLSARMKMPHDTDWKWYRVTRQFEFNKDGKLSRVFGVICDIDDEKRREKQLREQNEIDPVLKIYNRNAAVNKISKYLRKNPDRRDYALLVMDIDDFKNINDTYGHLYGDAVIEMTAAAIKEVVGNFGVAGRYGGDEFFAFLTSSDEDEIKKRADEIIAKIKEIHTADDNCITSSMGIVLGTSFEQTPVYKQMFECADKALYKVKKNGKAHWCIYTDELADSNSHAIDYEKEDEETNSEHLKSKDLTKVFLELSSEAKTSDAAVYSIIKYVTEKFNFDWMQIMQVNSVEDLITIKYEWCSDADFHNNSGRSGYYIHSDIMNFRNYFEKQPVFIVSNENTKKFSPKFQREFEKNRRHNVVYISDTTSEDNFFMFVCTRFDKEHLWTKEECDELNVATKMMAMYISQTSKETENERKLQRMVDYDRKTDLYSISQFYVQLGRLRKQANENGDDIVLFHIDIGNFLDFNKKFGIEVGDEIIYDLGEKIKNNSDPDCTISTHLDGSDIFYSAFRVKKGELDFIDKYLKEYKLFCDEKNKKYSGANIVIRVGVYVLGKNEDGGLGFDKGLYAKKLEKDRNRSFCVIYDESMEKSKS